MCESVQSFICNISYPNSLDALISFINEIGDYSNVETVLKNPSVEWTVPRWCKTGDIVLFMHAKTANAKISTVLKEYHQRRNSLSINVQERLEQALLHARKTYQLYGGKIFAIGRVNGNCIYDRFAVNQQLHWRAVIYAPIDEIYVLKTPVDISEFRSFIKISRQSSITPLFGESYELLKQLVQDKNRTSCPQYYLDSTSTPLPLKNINRENWIAISNRYRRSFFLEIQFRSFYVDYLLKELGDIKTVYSECTCYKANHSPTYVDNVVRFNGKYLPVEVKLDINKEKDICGQVEQYCCLDRMILGKSCIMLTPEQIYYNRVLIVDTSYVYMYKGSEHRIYAIFELDKLTSSEDIIVIRNKITESIK